ncbi:MAG: cobyrinate a,c-diamide synthase [Mariprofundaceae bacterium]|nr:cobyrinate a,c-diamide synthase [Mariprofundaceae bacterium]
MFIAGTQSGCGKTTVTLALMQYLRAQGKIVAPFKAGPDFLDPMWHQAVCQRTSYHLDTRMMGKRMSIQCFREKSYDSDVSVIEGVMGLFDGVKGVGGEGSSAHLAKTLAVPVILVVSAKGMSGSIVPLVEGFVARAKNMDVTICGIIPNHVGSENHAKILRELLTDFELPPLLAWMGKDAPPLPERHLGLKMPSEQDLPDFSDAFHVEKDFLTIETQRQREHKDSDKAQHQEHQRHTTKQTSQNTLTPLYPCDKLLNDTIIAVAKDAAFCFIYPENLEWLNQHGAEVQMFSPLAGEPVPHASDALWLPGGYPELHLETLSNSKSLASMVNFIEAGKPVLAECGGMMVLGEHIVTTKPQSHEEKKHAMAGILPCDFIMQDKLAGLGYREDASGVRGHEFHHSKRSNHADFMPAFDVKRGDAGIRYKHVRASYIHWYFASQSEAVAAWFGFM